GAARACADGGPGARAPGPGDAHSEGGDGDRRRRPSRSAPRPSGAGGGRQHPADVGAADLRRRSRRRPDVAGGGRARRAEAEGARLHDLAGDPRRHGRAPAPGRLRRDDPRPAEPSDPADDRARHRRQVLHGGDGRPAEVRLRRARLAPRAHEAVAGDHRLLRRRRRRPAGCGRRPLRLLVQEGRVRLARLGLAAGVAAGALIVAAPASATNECRGLNPCVAVAGPWVVVPTGPGTPRIAARYELSCPRGWVVGGTDAELSDRAIDLAFFGTSGSPVSPGITTARTMLFVGTYAGAGGRAPTFRPHIGCVPTSGGGQRTPTSVAAVFPPGAPTLRRVVTAHVGAPKRVAASCRADERLVDWYATRAF